MDIRQTLTYIGAPIGSKSYLFFDHSTLAKCHNILSFDRVREVIPAKIMTFYWIQSAYSLSDMLSKHWNHPSAYPMILKLLITRGNIMLIPKEETEEKEKENYTIENKKIKRKEIRKKYEKIKITKTTTTRGE